ncbi:hypothetical protein BDB00DRAFT_857157, partial [Zychaea mexicana]|uniref:uncharacterized protein n=1 Tax=Zychaea mexicana TaxID=64656 RepID=UPI0022FE7AF0
MEPTTTNEANNMALTIPPPPKIRFVPNLNLVCKWIPPSAVELMHNPMPDGNCGFRAL